MGVEWSGQASFGASSAYRQLIFLASASFADDALFVLWGRADAIVNQAAAAAAIIFDAFAARALQLNLKRGKSEVMFEFAGPGAY